MSFLDYFVDFGASLLVVLSLTKGGMAPSRLLWVFGLASGLEFLLEGPTGVLADRWGRSLSATASFVLRAVLLGVLVVWSNSTVALVALVVGSAAASTLTSGAVEAWLIDSLGVVSANAVQTDQLIRTSLTRGVAYEQFGAAASMGVVVLVGVTDAAAGYLVFLAASLAGMLVLVLPRWVRGLDRLALAAAADGEARRATGSTIREGYEVLRGLRRSAVIVLAVFLVMSLAVTPPLVQWPAFLFSTSESVSLVALLRLVASLLTVLIATWMARRSDLARWTAPMAVLAAVALVGATIATNQIGRGVLMAGFLAAWAVCRSGLRAEINRFVPSKVRATVLSAVNMVDMGLSGLVLIGLGLVPNLPVTALWWGCGVVTAAAAIAGAFALRRTDANPG